MIISWSGRKRIVHVLCLFGAMLSLLFAEEAYSAPGQLRRTVGRLQYYNCSAKDCTVEVKPENLPSVGFSLYGDYDDKYFKASFRKPESYMGRIVEVISYKNRFRGGEEIVKAIGFIK
jgi:hypothetical protein